MKNVFRADGKKKGCRAEIHEYRGATAKVEVEVPLGLAKKLVNNAVETGGETPISIQALGDRFDCVAISARIDSYDEEGRRVGGTGVIEFRSLTTKP